MRIKWILIIVLMTHAAFGENTMKNQADEISKHYFATPNVYQLDNMPKENLSDKITRQYIMGANSMIVK